MTNKILNILTITIGKVVYIVFAMLSLVELARMSRYDD